MINPQTGTDFFKQAEAYVEEGYGTARIEYYRRIDVADLTIERFFPMIARVVLDTNFHAHVIDQLWGELTIAFLNWDFRKIAAATDDVLYDALIVLPNVRKIEAIVQSAETLALWTEADFVEFHESVSGIRDADSLELRRLRYFKGIGDVNQFYLARSMGLDFAKPDRWLERIAEVCGYGSGARAVFSLVDDIGAEVQERPGVIDYVLWRWAADRGADALGLNSISRVCR